MSEAAEDNAKKQAAFVQFWLDQLDGYDQEFKRWEKRSERIVKRYRDERQEKSDGSPDYNFKFNALWSNVQTLSPAVYKKAPDPVVDRRYLDKDRIARYASMILERSLEVTVEECGFHQATRMAVLDYLLPGRGIIWNRYEPTYGAPVEPGPTANDDEGQATPAAARSSKDEDGENPEPAEAPRPVTWEKVYQDYVGWKNFRHSPAATWEEVWWVAKREFMTRRELRTRWPDAKDPQSGKRIADLIPLQDQTFKDWNDGGKDKPKKATKTAAVWEIWDKNNREVVFVAEGYPQAALERTADPLGLMNFWPCAKPLYATTTNDTLVPVPDYVEYQDQAEELDSLAARIKALTDAVRVNGVYDASIPELKRILQEGADNRLIAVAKWSEFAQKGGLDSCVDFLPLKDIVEALVKLQETFEITKRRMDEITGISDIVRGQSSGATKTATEQRIKGQFATLRLEDRQAEVARFCRDNLAIAAEIISEQFSPEILAEMTGMIPFIEEELKSDMQVAPPPTQPGMGHNGGPAMQQPDPALIQQQIKQAAQQMFMQAVELLKNDKMRTFRIDIETDSTVAIDKQAEKEAVVEMFTALGGFLEKSAMIGQAIPEFVPALGQSLMFAFRRFGVGRDVEGAWEQATDKIAQKVKAMEGQPKPPSPEEVKAQAEAQKQQMETQRAQMEAQIDQQKAQQDFALEQEKAKLEIEKEQMKLQLERERLQMEREKMGMQLQGEQQKQALQAQSMQQKAAIEAESMERQAEMGELEHERNMEAGERKHELDMETAEFKAKQAKKPKEKK